MANLTSMTIANHKLLKRCEVVIEHESRTFLHVGQALATIRDKFPYRDDFASFRDYCQQKWGFSDSRARQLMTACKVAQSVTRVTVPDEKTARVLNHVPAEERQDAPRSYLSQTEAGNEKPTAAGLTRYIEKRSEPATETTTDVAVVQVAGGDGQRERRRRQAQIEETADEQVETSEPAKETSEEGSRGFAPRRPSIRGVRP